MSETCECEYIAVLESGPLMVMRRPDCPLHGKPEYRIDSSEEASK